MLEDMICLTKLQRITYSKVPLSSSNAPSVNFWFAVILEKTIRIPRSLSVKAAQVLKGFLNKSPTERLGCHPQTGFTDIMNHSFYKTIDWELVG